VTASLLEALEEGSKPPNKGGDDPVEAADPWLFVSPSISDKDRAVVLECVVRKS
jgi:hypothetical protein